jgi:hypothetical protein
MSVAAVATLPVNQIYPSTLQMKAQLAGWKPAAVVAVTSLDSAFGHYLTALLGPPTTTQGQVLGWRLSWRPGSQQGISRTLVPRG